ncbi:hypothetical protein L917_09309 [Phytophthora nicotianae]|uniref:Uncharacterized protein n=3 Tax=Phytophthora nicotianae TaxID=4792 RepID=W2PA55_PHYN3|nr:hypothetical protein PPTG_24853 [Phytophthora nicotianae INRA-310]ETL92352.1 hypothetical protein L917_09309 [Phytophthora nicotianae]ETM45666.1 hypothetical protein L914_09333 [Phytophthora nicotianae]ETM97706.1 hypothetical protein PPTG_24853 [Phytophthora nicotianae INRA-310]ETO74541.1 hypothetical protein F444_09740 [Phytophthora nicotianae P1976]
MARELRSHNSADDDSGNVGDCETSSTSCKTLEDIVIED